MRAEVADQKPCLRLLQELQAEFSEQRNKLQAERDAIQVEFERVKTDLLARCKQAEDEVGTFVQIGGCFSFFGGNHFPASTFTFGFNA